MSPRNERAKSTHQHVFPRQFPKTHGGTLAPVKTSHNKVLLQSIPFLYIYNSLVAVSIIVKVTFRSEEDDSM